MKAIVAVGPDWGIGRDGELLARIPEDMRRFRRLTKSCPVVMGHSTFRSLPGMKPLPDRENLVLSRDTGLRIEGATVVHSLPEAFECLGERAGEAFVIGGERVYAALLPYCDRAYITHIAGAGLPAADRYFPDITDAALAERMGWRWVLTEEDEPGEYEGITYTFCTYANEGSIR